MARPQRPPRLPSDCKSVQVNCAEILPPEPQSFGDITSVPTLFLFDRSGKTARVFYGAPPDLHEQAEKTLDALVK